MIKATAYIYDGKPLFMTISDNELTTATNAAALLFGVAIDENAKLKEARAVLDELLGSVKPSDRGYVGPVIVRIDNH